MLKANSQLLRLAVVTAVLIFTFREHPAKAERRIWLHATINGKAARLLFDSGSERNALYEPGAKRLGLAFEPIPQHLPRDPLSIYATHAPDCVLRVDGKLRNAAFDICKAPDHAEVIEDGLVGWGVFSQDIVTIDGSRETMTVLTNMPAEVGNWLALRVQTNSGALELEVPGRGGRASIVRVDTGSSDGFALASQEWNLWSAAHPKQPRTSTSYVDSAENLVVSEEAWADNLTVGSLVLSDVPVMEGNKWWLGPLGPRYFGILGLAAIARMDLIIDGKHGVAFVRPKTTVPEVYEHNCLGAIFAPEDLAHEATGPFLARVAEGSPAYEAGVRDGDALLRITALKGSDLSWGFWSPTNGAKVMLSLVRSNQTFTTTVVLRHILAPPISPQPTPKNE